jgi:DNA-binding NarL/FixJ family response regulator
MQEIWKDIAGYEGLYQISNLGNVKSLERKIRANKHGGIKTIKERLLSICYNEHGYKIVNLWKDNKFITQRVHRLIANAFIPKVDGKPFINHKNSIRDDNRIENLEWCTQKENMQHAYNSGSKKQKNCENHHCAKLKNAQVLEIRRLYKIGYTNKQISNMFNINSGTISTIVNNRSWKRLL